jgi:hypothetical protein
MTHGVARDESETAGGCAACGGQLTAAVYRSRTAPFAERLFSINFGGGYGQFIDPCGGLPSYQICGRCRADLTERSPWIAAVATRPPHPLSADRPCDACNSPLRPVFKGTETCKQYHEALEVSFGERYRNDPPGRSDWVQAIICERCAYALIATHPWTRSMMYEPDDDGLFDIEVVLPSSTCGSIEEDELFGP